MTNCQVDIHENKKASSFDEALMRQRTRIYTSIISFFFRGKKVVDFFDVIVGVLLHFQFSAFSLIFRKVFVFFCFL